MATSKQPRKRSMRRTRCSKGGAHREQHAQDRTDHRTHEVTSAKSPYVVSEIPWERLKRSHLGECLFLALGCNGCKGAFVASRWQRSWDV